MEAAKVISFGKAMEYVEVDPATKEGRELLEKLRFREEDIVEKFTDEFTDYQVEVVRVKDYIRTADETLVHALKHKLFVFIRKLNKDGEWKTRLGLKTVNYTYTLIPHSELLKEIEVLITKAGHSYKSYIKSVGVNFRSLTITDKVLEIEEGVKCKLAFLINNSYNYTSAVRINLTLVDERTLYPLWSDIIYKKHREHEITAEDFDKSLRFAEEVTRALPLLKSIRVRVRDVLKDMEHVSIRRWVSKNGKKSLIEVPIGKKIVSEVLKTTGRNTDVYTLWRTVSHEVFSKNANTPGLSLRLKRKFEVMIAKLIENFMSSVAEI